MIYRLMTARLIAAPSEVLFDINEGRFKRPFVTSVLCQSPNNTSEKTGMEYIYLHLYS